MSGVSEPPATRPTLSAAASRLMVDAAVAEAESMSVPVTVVVVDESGVTKEMLRMDGAPLVSVQTAVNKAYAAAAIGMPPDDFYAAIESDGAAVAEFGTRPGLALIAGGLPVIADGRSPGAIGVAGAMTGAEDRRIAEVAIAKRRRLYHLRYVKLLAIMRPRDGVDVQREIAPTCRLRAERALGALSRRDGARDVLAGKSRCRARARSGLGSTRRSRRSHSYR